MLDSMQFPTKTNLTMEKVLRTEAELLAYVQSGSCNLQQQKQLAMAVRFAIDESIGQLAKPLTTRWEFHPAILLLRQAGNPAAFDANPKRYPHKNRLDCAQSLGPLRLRIR